MHTVTLAEGLGSLTQLWRDGRERREESQKQKYRKGVGDAKTDPAKTLIDTPSETSYQKVPLTMLWP